MLGMRFMALFTIISLYNVHSDHLSDVRDFSNKVAELTSPTTDVMDKLKAVIEQGPQFSKLANTVGSLIAAGFANRFQPDSPEANAIAWLRTQMEQHFNAEKGQHVFLGSSYRTKVTLILDEYRHLLNPVFHNEEYRNVFKAKCIGARNPENVLSYLEIILQRSCSYPKKQQIVAYARLLTAFDELEKKMKSQKNSFIALYFETAKNYLLVRITWLHGYEADRIIDRIQNLTPATQKELDKLLDDPVLTTIDPYGCFLTYSLTFNQFLTKPFMATISQLSDDLVRAQVFISACASVIHRNNTAIIDEIHRHTSVIVQRIGNYAVKYIEAMQQLAWPEISLKAASSILNNISPLPNDETAEIIQRAFSRRNPHRHYFQVVVTSASETPKEWAYSTIGNNYVNITSCNGVDVHVFRFAKTDSARARAAEKWYKEKKEEINAVLELNKGAYPDIILNSLSKKLAITAADRYGSILVLHKSNFFSMEAEVANGEALAPVFEDDTSKKLEFESKYWLIIHAYKVYIFL